MQEHPIVNVGIILVLLIVNAMASAAETAFDETLGAVVRKRAAAGEAKAVRLAKIFDRKRRCTTVLDFLRTVTVFLCGITFVNLVSTQVVPKLVKVFSDYRLCGWYLALSLVLLTIAFVWCIELLSIKVPKKLAFKYAEHFSFRACGFVEVFMALFRPMAFLAEKAARGIACLFGVRPGDVEENVTEEEILSIVTEGQEQGLLDEEEAEMISNVMDFDAKTARDVMTRKKNIIGIREGIGVEEALEFCLKENYSRFPIYEENMDDITGILHLKDLTVYYMENRNEPEVLGQTLLSEIAREPYFVPDTQNIDVLLRDMQEKKVHMAVVIDEYGQTAGIVAMEDLLEEIVGDIQDEYDKEEQDIVEDENGGWQVQGSASLEELGELLKLDFSEEEADTVNGFITSRLGRLVSEEEPEYPCVTEQGYYFRVIRVKGMLIDLVSVYKEEKRIEEKE